MKLCLILILSFLSIFSIGQKTSWKAIYDVSQSGKGVKGFTKLLKSDSNNAELYWRRGLVFNSIKQYNLAILDFDKSLSKDSSFAYSSVLEDRGLSYEMLGLFNDAILDFTNAIAYTYKQKDTLLSYGLEKLYYHRGRARFKLGDTINAIQDLDSSLKYWDLHFYARKYRAMLYSMVGKYQKAMSDYDFLKYKLHEGLGEFPIEKDNALLFYWRGIAKKNIGDTTFIQDLEIANKLKYYEIDISQLGEYQEAVYKKPNHIQ